MSVDFKTLSPLQMAQHIGSIPHSQNRPALDNRARAALKYYLAKTLPTAHPVSDAATRNTSPVSTLWDAFHSVPECKTAYDTETWPNKGRAPRAERKAEDTPQPQPTPGTPTPTPVDATDAAAKIAALLSGLTSGISEARAREIAAEEASKATRVEYRDRIIVQKGEKREPLPEGIRHERFADCMDVLEAGLNLMIVGPAGCGKTQLAQGLAVARQQRFGFTGALPAEYKLLGFVRPDGQVVKTVYRDMYENGGLFLFDEMDASSANALLAFNAGLANGMQDFPDCVVRQHADATMIAATNTFGHGADRQYVGRNQQDAAALDRWTILDIGYDEKMERALYGDNEWTALVQKVRKAVADLKIRHVVSMRATDKGKRLLERGWKLNKVVSTILFPGMKDDDVRRIKTQAGI